MATGDCGICAQLIDCGTVPVGNNFNRVVAAALCQIAEGGGGGGGNGVVVVETCLLVTDAATGISPGDIINMLQFFDTTVEPYVLTATLYFNVTTRALVTSVDASNSEPCPEESLGGDCETALHVMSCPQNVLNGSLVSETVTGVGATTSNLWSVSIINVGAADGVLDGQPFLRGEVFNLTGSEYVWPGGGTLLKTLPPISYDATGTTFRIRTFV